MGRHYGRQRRHLAISTSRVKPGDICGAAAVGSLGLKDNIPDPAVLVVLADLDRTELGLQRAVNIIYRNAEEHRLGTVDFGLQLLR